MGKKRAAGAVAVLLTTGLLGVAAPQSAQASGQPTEHSVGTLWDSSVGIPSTAKRATLGSGHGLGPDRMLSDRHPGSGGGVRLHGTARVAGARPRP
jgi:hypothetical protein